jgi:carbamoyl-phosphate synthase large subunit
MQLMRNTSVRLMRDLGNFACGCNVHFSLTPDTEEIIAI